VSIVTSLAAGQPMNGVSIPGRGKEVFVFSRTSSSALVPSPVAMNLGAHCPGVERLECEVDPSRPSGVEITNE
jgi:hypothetical protein